MVLNLLLVGDLQQKCFVEVVQIESKVALKIVLVDPKQHKVATHRIVRNETELEYRMVNETHQKGLQCKMMVPTNKETSFKVTFVDNLLQYNKNTQEKLTKKSLVVVND